MTTQINPEMVELDAVGAAFLTAYIEAKAKIREWSEKADIAAEQIKAQLGDAQVGLVNGRETVRYTVVETTRLDTKKLREVLSDEVLAPFETTSTSRRFTLVDSE